VRLLKVGGRLVYSTCSLNPIENEAVVASVLRTFGTGCVRLVNCSDALPGLPRRPGLRTWGVWHRGGFHQTWEALQERFWEKCPPLQSCFPPADPAELADGDGGFHLEHCVRLMPHDLNGSGFFVAVLEKISSHADSAGKLDDNEREVCVTDEVLSSADDAALQKEPSLEAEGPSTDIGAPWLASEPSDEPLRFLDSPFSTKVDYEAWLCMPRADQPAALIRAAAAQESFGNGSSSGRSEELRRHYQACALHEKVLHAIGGATVEGATAAVMGTPYAPLFVPSRDVIASLGRFFGLTGAFPFARLVARSPAAKVLLLISEQVLDLLRMDHRGVLRIVNCGVRCFEREEAKGCAVGCNFRACQDALQHFLGSLTKQRLEVGSAAAVRLLSCPPGSAGISSEAMADHEPSLAEALRSTCMPGSVILSCIGNDELPLHFAALYSPSGALVPRVKGLEREALLSRLETK